MNDLFNTPDPAISEETLRAQLTAKWTEKFPTADAELIKAKVESDLYIKTLESQKDELRSDYMKSQEEIQKSKALEQLIDRLNNKEVLPGNTPPPANLPPSNDIDFEKLFEDKYEQKKRSEIETENYNKVYAKLRDRFGNNVASVLAEQSNTLGLSKEDVNSLAKKSPDAFFRMLGLNDSQPKDLFMAPPRSDLRNDNYAPKTVKRTWSWYQAEKAKNPKWYWEPQTQLQMHRDADALGDAFEDGNFQ